MPNIKKAGYHAVQDVRFTRKSAYYQPRPWFTYTFENFFHPFVGELVEKLDKESLASVFDPVYQENLSTNFPHLLSNHSG